MKLRGGGFVVVVCALGCTHDFDAFNPVAGAGSDSAVDTPIGGKCTEAGAKAFSGHCYFPLAATKTWDDAKSECAAAGGHLVTITSSEESTAVEAMVSGSERWIGLRRDVGSPPVDASFKWITGEAATYKSWAPGEPNTSNECARILGAGHWGAQPCSRALAAICERDAI